jgi:hypothetical protein
MIVFGMLGIIDLFLYEQTPFPHAGKGLFYFQNTNLPSISK